MYSADWACTAAFCTLCICATVCWWATCRYCLTIPVKDRNNILNTQDTTKEE